MCFIHGKNNLLLSVRKSIQNQVTWPNNSHLSQILFTLNFTWGPQIPYNIFFQSHEIRGGNSTLINLSSSVSFDISQFQSIPSFTRLKQIDFIRYFPSRGSHFSKPPHFTSLFKELLFHQKREESIEKLLYSIPCPDLH